MKKYNGSTWVDTTLRQYKTATTDIEPTIYTDGTAITAYTIKGNTAQNGTPTPSNPVEVDGVGVRTENLWDENYTGITTAVTYKPIYVGSGTFTLSTNTPRTGGGVANLFLLTGNVSSGGSTATDGVWSGQDRTVTATDGYVTIIYRDLDGINPVDYTTMLNTGSTAKPYEPYGYKIPISSGGVTTNMYLGSTQTVRQIKKLVLDGTENWVENFTNHGYRFGLNVSDSMQSDTMDVRSLCTHLPLTVRGGTGLDVQNVYVLSADGFLIIKLSNSDRVSDLKTWLAQQYANSTPVTVWYVLVTAETAAVNEPLMKIGDYADTLSNAASIPTTEGANSITIDTTVQPSEFTATWTGWHNASVKEWDGNDWQ